MFYPVWYIIVGVVVVFILIDRTYVGMSPASVKATHAGGSSL